MKRRLCSDVVVIGHNVDSLFFKQEMELSLIGLQNAGKTSLVNVIAVSVFIPILFLSVSVYILADICYIN